MTVAREGPSARTILDIVTTVAMLFAAGAVAWWAWHASSSAQSRVTGPPVIPLPSEALAIDGAPALGNAHAPVVLIEYSDFQCPFCGKLVRDVLPALKAMYIDTAKVQLIFRHLPLPVHPRAEPAAEAAVCAADQGRFWPMHDGLFASGAKLEAADLRMVAQAAGVDLGPFETCLSTAGQRVALDAQMAKTLKLRGTPTLLIGTRQSDGRVRIVHVLPGVPKPNAIEALLDKLLGQRSTSED